MKNSFMLAFLAAALFFACAKEEVEQDDPYDFKIQHQGDSHLVKSKDDLQHFILHKLIHLDGAKLLNFTMQSMTDSEGTFQAILYDYTFEDKHIKMIMPLSARQDDTSYKKSFLVSCCMKCVSQIGCKNPMQQAVERCGQQLCACDGGTGTVDIEYF